MVVGTWGGQSENITILLSERPTLREISALPDSLS